MVLCMEECARALLLFDGYEEALAFFQSVPDSMLYTEPLRSTTEAAGDVLVAALGPVEELWWPRYSYKADSLFETYELKKVVIDVPIGGIEAVLRSEELQHKSENYAFSLALWWAMQQKSGHRERPSLLNRLLKSLRYARMSALFLAIIVQLKWVQDSGLLPSILTRAIWWRGDVPWSQPVTRPPSRVNEPHRQSYSATCSAYFPKASIESLQTPRNHARAPLGLVDGFPCYLELHRREGGQICVQFYSDFLDDAPGEIDWGEQDITKEPRLEYRLVGGTLGAIDLKPKKKCCTNVRMASVFLRCPANALVYNEYDEVKVELELKIKQHKDC